MWDVLFEQDIVLAFSAAPEIIDRNSTEKEIQQLFTKQGMSIQTIDGMLSAIGDAKIPFAPAVLNVERLCTIARDMDFRKLKEEEALAILKRSRIKLPGTDGFRGISTEERSSMERALQLYLTYGYITAEFYLLVLRAFIRQILESDEIQISDEKTLHIVIGEDGRDAYRNGGLRDYISQALVDEGAVVHDCGVLPTPGVQLYSIYNDISFAAMLTASHNPANQNGIKLFLQGYKLPNEGLTGEYLLSFYIYKIARETALAETQEALNGCSSGRRLNVNSEAVGILEQQLFHNLPRNSGDASIVYDAANGAFSHYAGLFFHGLGYNADLSHVEPDGSNINDGCGVGVLEGTRVFEGENGKNTTENYPSIIQELFCLGRENKKEQVMGIVNDGDGDRSYLLVYDRPEDRVYVLSGDELAYWLLREKEEGSVRLSKRGRKLYANTIESDLMCAKAAVKEFDLQHELLPVGDKWLLDPFFRGSNETVANEESGHIIFETFLTMPEGYEKAVYIGNGFLAALKVLSYVQKRRYTGREIAFPFEPGHKASDSVFFIQKEQFYRGSSVWKENQERIVGSARENNLKWEELYFSQDEEVLAVVLLSNERTYAGMVFVRNSGTENKLSLGGRCALEYSVVIDRILEELFFINSRRLKDVDNDYFKWEKQTIRLLSEKPRATSAVALQLEEVLGRGIKGEDFKALLYGMEREKIIKKIGNNEIKLTPRGISFLDTLII